MNGFRNWPDFLVISAEKLGQPDPGKRLPRGAVEKPALAAAAEADRQFLIDVRVQAYRSLDDRARAAVH